MNNQTQPQRRKPVLKNAPFTQRYPKTFMWSSIVLGLGVFYSKVCHPRNMDILGWFGVGLFLRVSLTLYSVLHDTLFTVPYTDVDYHVFSDAAEYVSVGESPYRRATYRYPPLIAWMLVPNVLFPLWGKLLFSVLDLAVAWLLLHIVRAQGIPRQTADQCALVWLLNPLSIIISSRGNSDSVIATVVLLCLAASVCKRSALAGLTLGLAIHIRLYPLVYSPAVYLSFATRPKNGLWSTFLAICKPNVEQLKLVACCVWFLTISTAFSYYLYGDEFAKESIIYHLIRKDTKHNFSLFFYLLYLNPDQPGLLMFVPQAFLLLVLSLSFGRKADLPFCFFALSFVIVTYNPVVTSQYWVWVMSLLPVCLPRLRLRVASAIFLAVIWSLAQLAWLVPAYMLEFRGRNTFFFIWIQGIGVFCANIAVLGRLIHSYDYVPVVDKVD